MDRSMLLFEDSRGIYIPQNFAGEVDHSLFTGYSQEDIDILLEGSDHEHYWETWDYILNNAECNFLGSK